MTRSHSRRPPLLAELAVVFLGVYGAFFLDGCREQRERDARRDQILQMLAEDFRDASESIALGQEQFEAGIGRFLESYANGEQPTLLPIPIPAYEAVDTWGAVLSAGGLDSLDVETIRSVESVLAQISPMAETAREYNAYVREVLVPNLDKDQSEYYQEDGTLRSKYLWYYFSIRTIRVQLEALVAATNEVAGQLERAL